MADGDTFLAVYLNQDPVAICNDNVPMRAMIVGKKAKKLDLEDGLTSVPEGAVRLTEAVEVQERTYGPAIASGYTSLRERGTCREALILRENYGLVLDITDFMKGD